MKWIRTIALLNLIGLAFSLPAWAYDTSAIERKRPEPNVFLKMLSDPVAILIIVAIVVGIGLYIHHNSKSSGGQS